MIKILVPATSANVGPGFDCFGLAYAYYNEFLVEKANSMQMEGCDPSFINKNNLFNKSYPHQILIYLFGKAIYRNDIIVFNRI